MTIEIHPYADIFPAIFGEHREALLEDIRANGVREPITLWRGQIIDGKNRYTLAIEAGFDDGDLKYDEMDDDAKESDILDWVLSRNLHRRQVTASQRAAIAIHIGLLQRTKEEVEAGDSSGRSSEAVAKRVGSSKRYIDLASRLHEQNLGLFEDVRAGRIALTAAIKQHNAAGELDVDTKDGKSGKVADSDEGYPDHLADVFVDAKTFDDLGRRLNQIQKELAELCAESQAVAYLDAAEVKAAITQARTTLRYGKPYRVCPVCKGEHSAMTKGGQCVCKDRGYVNKATLMQIQAE